MQKNKINFNENWMRRSFLAVQLMKDELSHLNIEMVCDFGCGDQKLKGFLDSSCQYLGIDIDKDLIPRPDIICDFDIKKPVIALKPNSIAFALGLLERLENIERFFSMIGQMGFVALIFSYLCCELDSNKKAIIRSLGLKNGYALTELLELIRKTEWQVYQIKYLKPRKNIDIDNMPQYLFVLISKAKYAKLNL